MLASHCCRSSSMGPAAKEGSRSSLPTNSMTAGSLSRLVVGFTTTKTPPALSTANIPATTSTEFWRYNPTRSPRWTLTPAGSDGIREENRQTVNAWIRNGGAFDAVIDFDAATLDPANPAFFLPEYDSGDHLHPGDAGYAAMADAIDLALFK